MTKILFINFLLLALLHLQACGPSLGQPELPGSPSPVQDALLYYSSDEWPISCYFYDPQSKDYGQNLPLWNQAWVWAKTPEGAHVHAKGKREGGYIVADSIYYSKGKKVLGAYIDIPGAEKLPIVDTNQMEQYCQESIDRQNPGKGYKLIRMVASRNVLSITNVINKDLNFFDNAYPLVVGEQANPNQITRVVVFGDSLSDTGRLKRWTQVMPERPFFLGRFSNGGTWSDFLAQMAKVAVLNYSTGGAVTKVNVSSTVNEILHYIREVGRYFVTGSIRNFIADYRKNELDNGQVPAADKTLFIIWGGANDFLSKFDRKSELNTLIDKPDTPGVGGNSIAEQTVLNVADEVRGLIALGARNIVVVNIPDIGKTPRMASTSNFRQGTPDDDYAFAEGLTKLIQSYNEKLANKVTELQGANPGVKIILFDSAQALQNLMEGKGPKGEANFNWGVDRQRSFAKLSSPGKPDIIIGKKCYTGGYLGSTNPGEICPNASEMIFWDDVHPTAMGHCGIAFLLHEKLYKEGLVREPADYASYRRECSK